MTSSRISTLAPDERTRPLEMQTWGTSSVERSYSSRGKATIGAMPLLSDHRNRWFCLRSQMAGSRPRLTRHGDHFWHMEFLRYKSRHSVLLHCTLNIVLWLGQAYLSCQPSSAAILILVDDTFAWAWRFLHFSSSAFVILLLDYFCCVGCFFFCSGIN